MLSKSFDCRTCFQTSFCLCIHRNVNYTKTLTKMSCGWFGSGSSHSRCFISNVVSRGGLFISHRRMRMYRINTELTLSTHELQFVFEVFRVQKLFSGFCCHSQTGKCGLHEKGGCQNVCEVLERASCRGCLLVGAVIRDVSPQT